MDKLINAAFVAVIAAPFLWSLVGGWYDENYAKPDRDRSRQEYLDGGPYESHGPLPWADGLDWDGYQWVDNTTILGVQWKN